MNKKAPVKLKQAKPCCYYIQWDLYLLCDGRHTIAYFQCHYLYHLHADLPTILRYCSVVL